jgi:formamidase
VADAKGELAHPGDILVVEICNLGALVGDEWGFTGTFDRDNGGMELSSQPRCTCSMAPPASS